MNPDLASEIVDRLMAYPGGNVRVVDEDGLVRSIPVLDLLASREIEALTWSDPVGSRLEWARLAPSTQRIVIVDRPERSAQLPVDVQVTAPREVVLTVEDLFPPLSSGVVRSLEWADRAAAFGIARELPAKRLDEAATASILLRRIHRLDPDTMAEPPVLLAGLLGLHRVVRGATVSPSLAAALANKIGDPIAGLGTSEAVIDRSAFLAWLVEAWRAATTISSAGSLRALLFGEGPGQVLDDYLRDGLLEPADPSEAVAGLPFGVGGDSATSRAGRIDRELVWIRSELDAAEPTYQGWREIAERWADVLATRYADSAEGTPPMLETRAVLNERFRLWLERHYHELASLPSIPTPAMVHRTANAMEGRLGASKLALVVIDGLSLALWRALAPIIRRDGWHINDGTSFAWLPTITSISRQAIFSGRPPLSFAGSIGTVAKEAEYWQSWWADAQKLAPHEVGYAKLHLRNLGTAGLTGDTEFMSALGRRVLGVVVEDVDHEAHGERLGEGSFHAAIRAWAQAGHLTQLLSVLFEEGYEVVLTSDHGFAEVKTIGVSQAGVLADKHGRFEVFADDLLASQSILKGKPPGRWRWGGFGLPADYHVVFAPLDGALKPLGDRLLTHGGPTIEEVIVPWVRMST